MGAASAKAPFVLLLTVVVLLSLLCLQEQSVVLLLMLQVCGQICCRKGSLMALHDLQVRDVRCRRRLRLVFRL